MKKTAVTQPAQPRRLAVYGKPMDRQIGIYKQSQIDNARACSNRKHKPFHALGPCLVCNPDLLTVQASMLLDAPEQAALYTALLDGTVCSKNDCIAPGEAQYRLGAHWCDNHWREYIVLGDGEERGFPEIKLSACSTLAAGREAWTKYAVSSEVQAVSVLLAYLHAQDLDFYWPSPEDLDAIEATRLVAYPLPFREVQKTAPAVLPPVAQKIAENLPFKLKRQNNFVLPAAPAVAQEQAPKWAFLDEGLDHLEGLAAIKKRPAAQSTAQHQAQFISALSEAVIAGAVELGDLEDDDNDGNKIYTF